MANRHWEQDKEATVYIGNLDERVTDALVWELMLQAGKIVNVHLPKDRVTQSHQGFGFVEFVSEEDAEYAARIMNQIRLYGKPIRVNKASADKQKTVEVGAELFIGNLDPLVDEKTLYDTFSTFGTLVAAPKIARDDNGLSRGFGFVSFDNFDSSDKAMDSMQGQYLMNKPVTVSYAYKKDGKGERHGDQAERLLASQARKNNVQVQMISLPPALVNGPPSQAPVGPASTNGPSGGPPPSAPQAMGGNQPGPYPPSGGHPHHGPPSHQGQHPPQHMPPHPNIHRGFSSIQQTFNNSQQGQPPQGPPRQPGHQQHQPHQPHQPPHHQQHHQQQPPHIPPPQGPPMHHQQNPSLHRPAPPLPGAHGMPAHGLPARPGFAPPPPGFGAPPPPAGFGAPPGAMGGMGRGPPPGFPGYGGGPPPPPMGFQQQNQYHGGR